MNMNTDELLALLKTNIEADISPNETLDKTDLKHIKDIVIEIIDNALDKHR